MREGGDSRRFLDAKAQRSAKVAKESKPNLLRVFAFLCAFASKKPDESCADRSSAP